MPNPLTLASRGPRSALSTFRNPLDAVKRTTTTPTSADTSSPYAQGSGPIKPPTSPFETPIPGQGGPSSNVPTSPLDLLRNPYAGATSPQKMPDTGVPVPQTGASFTPAPAPIPMIAGGGLIGPGNNPTPVAGPTLTADQIAASAAAGAGRSAAASSAAAGQAGQLQEQEQAVAMANASQAAALGASAPAAPNPLDMVMKPPPTPQSEFKPALDTTPANLDLQDQGYITELGQFGADEVLRGLKTNEFAPVTAARTRADRNSSLRTGQAQIAAEEAAAAAGFKPGSLEYQRAVDRALAGANTANLEETNAVNELGRGMWYDYLNRADGMEKDAYGRSVTERAHDEGRSDLAFTRNINERAHDESRSDLDYARRIEERNYQTGREDVAYNRGKTDETVAKTEMQAFVNSVEDPKARQVLQNALARGEDPRKLAGTLFAPDGTLKPEYRSMDPGQIDLEARKNELRILNPTWDEAKLALEATKELRTERAVTQNPVTKESQQAAFDEALTKAKSQGFASLTDDERTTLTNGLQDLRPTSVPVGEGPLKSFAQENPFIKIDGQIYETKGVTMHKPGKMKNMAFLEVAGPNGEKFWIVTLPDGLGVKIARYILGTDGSSDETHRWQDRLEDF